MNINKEERALIVACIRAVISECRRETYMTQRLESLANKLQLAAGSYFTGAGNSPSIALSRCIGVSYVRASDIIAELSSDEFARLVTDLHAGNSDAVDAIIAGRAFM